jgi:hypothetical protein
VVETRLETMLDLLKAVRRAYDLFYAKWVNAENAVGRVWPGTARVAVVVLASEVCQHHAEPEECFAGLK